MRTWNVRIPVVASYRFSVGKATALRIGAGPFFQESLSGKCYANGTDTKTNLSGTFADRFNLGAMGEIAIHTGNHLSYMLQVQYPFLKEGWIRKTMTLSAGIRYSFWLDSLKQIPKLRNLPIPVSFAIFVVCFYKFMPADGLFRVMDRPQNRCLVFQVQQNMNTNDADFATLS